MSSRSEWKFTVCYLLLYGLCLHLGQSNEGSFPRFLEYIQDCGGYYCIDKLLTCGTTCFPDLQLNYTGDPYPVLKYYNFSTGEEIKNNSCFNVLDNGLFFHCFDVISWMINCTISNDLGSNTVVAIIKFENCDKWPSSDTFQGHSSPDKEKGSEAFYIASTDQQDALLRLCMENSTICCPCGDTCNMTDHTIIHSVAEDEEEGHTTCKYTWTMQEDISLQPQVYVIIKWNCWLPLGKYTHFKIDPNKGEIVLSLNKILGISVPCLIVIASVFTLINVARRRLLKNRRCGNQLPIPEERPLLNTHPKGSETECINPSQVENHSDLEEPHEQVVKAITNINTVITQAINQEPSLESIQVPSPENEQIEYPTQCTY